MCDSLPWTPMNRRSEFDAASFILGGEIRNRTNKQTNKQTHTHKRVNLSVCVDNKVLLPDVSETVQLTCYFASVTLPFLAFKYVTDNTR